MTSPTNKALSGIDTVIYTSKVISVSQPQEHGFEATSFGDNYKIDEGTWEPSTNVSLLFVEMLNSFISERC